jgi:Spy/CpxP family protein refolding chaperone
MSGKIKPWLVLAVIFIAGGLSGSALTMALSSHYHHPPMPGKIEKLIMMRMTRELNLTPDQQDKIRPIVGAAAKQFQEVHREEVRRVSQIIKQTNDQITPILTAEQKVQLDKLQTEGDNLFFGHPHGWGSPGEHFHGGGPNDGGPNGGPPQDQPPAQSPPAPVPDHQSPGA